MINEVIAVVLGYLIGSIPSAYIIGHLWGKIDLRQEGDGRISAAAVNRRLGKVPFLLVVIMDVGAGVLAVFIAKMLTDAPLDVFTDSQLAVLIAGFVAVVGHDWPVFLKFKGGLGATTIWGVLVALVWWQTLVVAASGFIVFLIIKRRRPGLITGLIIVALSIVLLVQSLVQGAPLILAVYPYILILLMVLKRFQVSKTNPQ
ncbi:MAG: glycerol-3-phosphate acyltransferase [Chloroflexota bacterium]|nr:MAG: glycerol-3-phosphate acyltransferase [Chloroflexota bacterium]